MHRVSHPVCPQDQHLSVISLHMQVSPHLHGLLVLLTRGQRDSRRFQQNKKTLDLQESNQAE